MTYDTNVILAGIAFVWPEQKFLPLFRDPSVRDMDRMYMTLSGNYISFLVVDRSVGHTYLTGFLRAWVLLFGRWAGISIGLSHHTMVFRGRWIRLRNVNLWVDGVAPFDLASPESNTAERRKNH